MSECPFRALTGQDFCSEHLKNVNEAKGAMQDAITGSWLEMLLLPPPED
jgi:hypothetical protein